MFLFSSVRQIFVPLNKPQKTAILKTLMCNDYVLIKGYPGTGRLEQLYSPTYWCALILMAAVRFHVLRQDFNHSSTGANPRQTGNDSSTHWIHSFICRQHPVEASQGQLVLNLEQVLSWVWLRMNFIWEWISSWINFQHNVPFVRLGRLERIHPNIQCKSSHRLTQGISSVEEMTSFYESIVSVMHWTWLFVSYFECDPSVPLFLACDSHHMPWCLSIPTCACPSHIRRVHHWRSFSSLAAILLWVPFCLP